MSTIPGSGPARQAAREVAGWVPPLARIGYAAKGIVYGIVGVIAVRAATAGGGPRGSTEALATLADEPGGRLVLLLIALGLLGHVVWRLVQAILDPEHPGRADGKRVGMRLFYVVSAVVYGALGWTAWRLSRGAGGGDGDGQEIWIAKLLAQPFGTWLVMLAGLGVVGYGVHQLVKAWKGDVNRRMEGADAATRGWARTIGRIGTGARGLVLLPIGWFVFRAGRYYNASEAVDTGEVLRMLERGWLLAAVGLGLLAYGVHQVLKAFHRRIGRPA
ncbi:DUF1206 domain-containing protein [Luteimonas pelagia]